MDSGLKRAVAVAEEQEVSGIRTRMTDQHGEDIRHSVSVEVADHHAFEKLSRQVERASIAERAVPVVEQDRAHGVSIRFHWAPRVYGTIATRSGKPSRLKSAVPRK